MQSTSSQTHASIKKADKVAKEAATMVPRYHTKTATLVFSGREMSNSRKDGWPT